MREKKLNWKSLGSVWEFIREWNGMIIREWKGIEWNEMYLSNIKEWKRMELSNFDWMFKKKRNGNE